ncbi:UDP-glucose 4-epimerase GalE [Ostreiculturibacter nitratireducens]|uniref:UDP-glucose 4-epimerase GalE n=1 Tax=Ostreiculturibacter nitratireducens TaxID=3075226 RepID=UPI0031B5BE7C
MLGGARILVTGGAGFIGSHACKALAEAGALPITYDNLSTGHADAVRWGPLYAADLRNRAALRDVLRTERIDGVLHFAASAYVGESVEDPAKYYDNNVGGMIALLETCREAGIGQIVLSSSCATYGIPDQLPIREDTPQRPINPYGRTKLICEQMLADHEAAYGTRYASLRYFNAAGADPDGSLGERHAPETHLIPLALLSAAGRRGRLDILGTDYDTPDGTCIRDYIHVTDLARAHLLALAHLLKGGRSLSLNLGTGRGHSVREIISAVENLTGCPLPVRERPRRVGDPPALVADPGRAAEVLGFRARMSDIDTLVRHAAAWFGMENKVVEPA